MVQGTLKHLDNSNAVLEPSIALGSYAPALARLMAAAGLSSTNVIELSGVMSLGGFSDVETVCLAKRRRDVEDDDDLDDEDEEDEDDDDLDDDEDDEDDDFDDDEDEFDEEFGDDDLSDDDDDIFYDDDEDE